jgi:hypothetical protein
MLVPDFLRGRIRVALAVSVLALVLAVACSKSSKKPNEPEVPVAPTPNSPRNALALLEWCWDQRNPTVYRRVFTNDFGYDFAASDTIPTVIDRTEELAIANNLFVQGVTGHPAATVISFGLDNTLYFQPDDRPGKGDARFHQRVRSNVRLVVNTPGPDYSTTGQAIFYVTRGDSAAIPPDLVAAGAVPDSTRWYVDHWTDVTDCPAGKSCVTVGKIKAAYVGP